MQSKDRIRVRHILDEAGEACKYAEAISFDEFVEDGKTVSWSLCLKKGD